MELFDVLLHAGLLVIAYILLFQADGREIVTVRKEKRYVGEEDVVGGSVER
jgi:hypothetical protein